MSSFVLVLVAVLVLAPARMLAWAIEIEFVTKDLPWAIADKGYAPSPLEVRLSGSCPVGGVGYTVVGGSLPPGIQLSRLGYFSGSPRTTGSFEINVRAANGCSWSARHFTIVVTRAPVLTVQPERLLFRWTEGAEAPAEQTLQVSATWPGLSYTLNTGGSDWLSVVADHGFTPRQGSAMAADLVHVRVDPAHLKPGRYPAALTVSAWQSMPVAPIPIELVVTAK